MKKKIRHLHKDTLYELQLKYIVIFWCDILMWYFKVGKIKCKQTNKISNKSDFGLNI